MIDRPPFPQHLIHTGVEKQHSQPMVIITSHPSLTPRSHAARSGHANHKTAGGAIQRDGARAPRLVTGRACA